MTSIIAVFTASVSVFVAILFATYYAKCQDGVTEKKLQAQIDDMKRELEEMKRQLNKQKQSEPQS